LMKELKAKNVKRKTKVSTVKKKVIVD